jgi:arylsulfatase A-like enzyme
MTPALRDAARRALSTAALGAAIVALAGLLEAWYRFTGDPASRRLPTFGPEFFWVAPAGLLLLLAPLIAAVAALRAAWPRGVTLPRAVLVLSLPPLFGLSLMLLREKVPDAVHFVMALGVATVLMRATEGRERAVTRGAALALPLLLAVPLATLALTLRARTHGEAAALRALPAAPAGARNVLLIVWDTVRERQLSLYGHARPTTPHLDRHAAGAVVFGRAYSTAPWTLPSHASMFTGRHRQGLDLDWVTPLRGDHPTLAEVLAGQGYRTGGFTANLDATNRPTGLARGFHHYEDWPLTSDPVDLWSHLTLVRNVRRYPGLRDIRRLKLRWKEADVVTDSFLAWLDATGGTGRPFFAFLNYFNAHFPYRSPAPYRARFGQATREERYEAAIAFQDDELDRLFRALAARGELDRTVVILTSDHGEAFGEHDFVGHGRNLYVEQLHVPLVIRAPGRAPPGLRLDVPVSLRDVARTALDLALDDPPDGGLEGGSLARFWSEAAPPPDTIVAGVHQMVNDSGTTQITKGNASAAIAGRWHYIVDGTGAEELFDLATDPRELRNQAGVDSLAPVLAAFRRLLGTRFGGEWTAAAPDPARRARPPGGGD